MVWSWVRWVDCWVGEGSGRLKGPVVDAVRWIGRDGVNETVGWIDVVQVAWWWGLVVAMGGWCRDCVSLFLLWVRACGSMRGSAWVGAMAA